MQPCVTKLIFEQENVDSVTFLLSNYVSSFIIPYENFASFSKGPVTLYISQAYSTTESAYKRTSDFSPPFSMMFNATQHHYQIIEQSGLNSIPLKVNVN